MRPRSFVFFPLYDALMCSCSPNLDQRMRSRRHDWRRRSLVPKCYVCSLHITARPAIIESHPLSDNGVSLVLRSPDLHHGRAGPIPRHANVINGRIATPADTRRRETWNERGLSRGAAHAYGQRAGTRGARRAFDGGTKRRRAALCAGTTSSRNPPVPLVFSQP